MIPLYEYVNLDWEKQNDIQDSKRQGKDCSGCFCLNCDFFNECDNIKSKKIAMDID